MKFALSLPRFQLAKNSTSLMVFRGCPSAKVVESPSKSYTDQNFLGQALCLLSILVYLLFKYTKPLANTCVSHF